jgi:hypothetical protein
MLPVSLVCSFLLPLRYSLRFICPVSCVPYIASFSGLPFFSLPLRYSPTFICPVSCVSYVASFSGLFIFIAPSVFSNIYLSCVLCTLCCQFLSIALFYCPFGILQHLFVLCLVYPMLPISLDWPCVLPLRYSLTFVCSVSCVPYVASFSRLPLFIAPLVFSNIYLFCVLCTLCCKFLSIALVYCPFGIL